MMLSVVIPAYNEDKLIVKTITSLSESLRASGIIHEIIVVIDHSTDATAELVYQIAQNIEEVSIIQNIFERGYGSACISGIEQAKGDYLAFFMADLSDSPYDLVCFYKIIKNNSCDMVFGDRWSNKKMVKGYPVYKKFVNRIANYIISFLFGIHYYDITNGFKLYSMNVINFLKPYKAKHFNFALELPLRAVLAGFSFEVVSNTWVNNRPGMSNLKLMTMSGKYLLTLLDCLKQKYFKR